MTNNRIIIFQRRSLLCDQHKFVVDLKVREVSLEVYIWVITTEVPLSKALNPKSDWLYWMALRYEFVTS